MNASQATLTEIDAVADQAGADLGRLTAARTPAASLAAVPSPRDGVDRPCVVARLDSAHRVTCSKVTAPLGWAPDDSLVAQVRTRQVVIRRGRQERYADVPVTIDPQGRLLLPAAVTGALNLQPRDQVFLVAVPETGEIHLVAAADLTAVLVDRPTPTSPPTVSTKASRVRTAAGSGIRQRWRPPA